MERKLNHGGNFGRNATQRFSSPDWEKRGHSASSDRLIVSPRHDLGSTTAKVVNTG